MALGVPAAFALVPTPATRVVVFHAPGVPPAPTLLTALDRRDVQRIAKSHPWSVLAALLAPGAGASVLLLHEPAGLPGVGELLASLDRYAKHIKIWVYDSGSSPSLRNATESDRALLRVCELAAARGEQEVEAPSKGAAGQPVSPARAAAAFIAGAADAPIRTVAAYPPQLRIVKAQDADHAWTPPPLTQAPPPAPPAPQPLLSPEELEMLLSDGPMNRT